MATVIQKADELFQLNRNFEAEIEEILMYIADTGSSSGPSDLLQFVDVQSSSVSETRLMNMISGTLVNVMKPESQLGEGTRDDLIDFQKSVDSAKELVRVFNLDLLQLRHIILKQVENFPLEFLWIMHESNLLPVEDLLQQSDAKDHMVACFVRSCLQMEETTTVHTQIIPPLMRGLFSLGYDHVQRSVETENASPIAKACLFRVMKEVCSCQSSGKDEDCSCSSGECCDVFGLVPELTNAAVMGSFFSELLETVFSEGEDTPMLISNQDDLIYGNLSHGRRKLFSKVAEHLSVEVSFRLLHSKLTSTDSSLGTVLMFASCLLHSVPMSRDKMLEFCRDEAKLSLEQDDKLLLTNVLLLARQCSLEGSHVFPSYSSWFQANLGQGPKTLITSRRQLLMLLDVLKGFIPHDSPKFLKVQCRCPLKSLAKCQDDIQQYQKEVRCRLQQLNVKEPIEDSVLLPIPSGDYHNIINDVEQAVKEFGESQHIPSFVAEASLFRKPYYGRFLQTLLSSEISSNLRSAKDAFILELERAKKIPSNMLKQYRKIESSIQVDKDESLTSQALQNIRDVFKDLLASIQQGKKKGVSVLVSKLAHAIPSASSAEAGSPESDDKPVAVDLSSPGILHWQLQLTDVIMESTCECVIKGTPSPSAPAPSAPSPSAPPCELSYWLGKLVDMLNGKKWLHRVLLVRLWDLIANKMGEMSCGHIVGLSAVVVYLSLSKADWTELVVERSRMWSVGREPVHLKSGGDYSVFIVEHILFKTHVEMTNALRFLYHCMQYKAGLRECSGSILDPLVAKLFRYLTDRFVFAKDNSFESFANKEGLLKKKRKLEDQQLLETCCGISSRHSAALLPFSTWMSMELWIAPQDESSGAMSGYLRSEYLITMTTKVYLSSGIDLGGFDGSLEDVFREVFSLLAESHSAVLPPSGLLYGSMLLQSISLLMVAECDVNITTDNRTILLDCIKSTLERRTTEGHVSECFKAVLVKSCLKLCMHLPPHLLLVKNTHCPPDPRSLLVLAQLLSSQDFCLLSVNRLLPLETVQLVVKSFVCILRSSKEQDVISTSFQEFLCLSPLFLASLSRLTKSKVFESEINTLIGGMRQKMATFQAAISTSSWSATEDPSNMVKVVVMFEDFITDDISKTLKSFERLMQCEHGDRLAQSKIAVTLLDLALTHLGAVLLDSDVDSKPPPIIKLVKECLHCVPESVVAFVGDLNSASVACVDHDLVVYLKCFREHFPASRSRLSLNPLLFFWIVRNLMEVFLIELCKNVCVATVAMDMYSEYLSLQTDAQYLEICSKEQRSHEPFSVEYLQQLHRLLVRILPDGGSNIRKFQSTL